MIDLDLSQRNSFARLLKLTRLIIYLRMAGLKSRIRIHAKLTWGCADDSQSYDRMIPLNNPQNHKIQF